MLLRCIASSVSTANNQHACLIPFRHTAIACNASRSSCMQICCGLPLHATDVMELMMNLDTQLVQQLQQPEYGMKRR